MGWYAPHVPVNRFTPAAINPTTNFGRHCCSEGRCVKANGFPEHAAEWPNKFLMTEAFPRIAVLHTLHHSRYWIPVVYIVSGEEVVPQVESRGRSFTGLARIPQLRIFSGARGGNSATRWLKRAYRYISRRSLGKLP